MGRNAERLLQRVAARQRACSLGASWYRFALILAGVYAVLLLCSRLLGIIPDWFAPISLLVVAAGSGALAISLYRRAALIDAARAVDTRMQTEDLFLTAPLIASSAGRYKPLVLSQAEKTSPSVRPKLVVPFRWGARARNAAVVLCALLAGIFLLPQLDPFGKEEQRQQADRRRERIEKARKATVMRLAALRADDPASQLSRDVARGTDELKQSFDAMKPDARQGNLKRLGQDKNRLGELWRKASEEKLKRASSQPLGDQRFGKGESEKTSQWREGMKKGDVSSLKSEIGELKRQADSLAQMPEGAEKSALEEQMKRRMDELSEFLGSELNSETLNAALARAMEQLEAGKMEELSAEALKGLQESLDLSELELESLAQSMRDLEALEQALETLQLAERLNELEALDGEACKDCQGIGDYAQMYRKLLAGRCASCGAKLGEDGVCAACGGRGAGQGMIGPGTGKGGQAPESEDAETDFKAERSRADISAGKMLLSVKSRGTTEAGEASTDYKYVEEIKKGASEAILHEQVPPSYHEAIRNYFDTLETANGEPAEE